MRRSGYNSLDNSKEGEDGETEVDGHHEDIEEAKPFTEVRFGEERTYKKTLCLVFTLFFGGFVSTSVSERLLIKLK